MSGEARMKLINDHTTPMHEVAQLAQSAGVAVVERGGEFAFCDAKQVPAGWHRFSIGQKRAA